MSFILRAFRVCVPFLTAVLPVVGQSNWSVTSPDKHLIFTIDQPADQNNSLFYQVSLNGKTVLGQAPLGVTMSGSQGDFVRDLVFQNQSSQKIEETYQTVSGKKQTHHHHARQITLCFENGAGMPMHLIIRACNEGVAWRYHFPGSGDAEIVDEASAFKLPAETEGWLQKYLPYYEDYYQHRELDQVGYQEIGFPALLHHPDGAWVLLTEAAVYEDYAGGHLRTVKSKPGCLKVALPDKVSWHRPWTTPWRVAIVAKQLGTIVESTLVDDLNPPCEVEDRDWIQPGRATFPWWSDYQANSDPDKLKWFIDFAAKMGWEWLEFDTGLVGGDVTDDWRTEDWVPELVEYAKQKGVKCFGWEAWHKLDTAEERKTVLGLLKKFGFRGVKVDFLNSDSQERFAVRDAVIHFHGCTLPYGWSRTWPHLMTMEAVRGAECYKFDKLYPEMAPTQNAIIPFTRNAVGPMDYTPVTISPRAVGRTTTEAHELALSTIFESGWTCFADTPGAYTGWAGQSYLKHVPVVWDDIHFMDGEPGRFVCLARRKGSDWYVAGINGEVARKVKLAFEILAPGRYVTQLYHDNETEGIVVDKLVVDAGEPLVIEMPARGGFCMRIKDSFKKE